MKCSRLTCATTSMRANCIRTVLTSACSLTSSSTVKCTLKTVTPQFLKFPNIAPSNNFSFGRENKMFRAPKILKLTIVMLALVAVASGGIFSHHKHKNKKDQNGLPEGIPVLWRAPKDIRQRDL